MIRDICNNSPSIVDTRASHPRWQTNDRQTGVPFWDRFFWVAANSFPSIARNFDFSKYVSRMIEVVCAEEFGVWVTINPYDHALTVSAISVARPESDPYIVIAVLGNGTVFDPMRIRFFVAARPSIDVVNSRVC